MIEERGELEHEGAGLAWRRVAGAGPTVVWLGGFRSDMTGTKAQALAEWAAASGRAYVRFDYFGHGVSSGDFLQGTITRWRGDALAVIDALTQGPLVLVGSSMGGWLTLLTAMARRERVVGLVLIAPAADFTERLIWDNLDAEGRAVLSAGGVLSRPSDYGEPYHITGALIEDGRRWQILPGPIDAPTPLRILQGGADDTVPWRHALSVAEAVEGEDVVFTLIRDGDHQLSRPADIARIIAAVEEVIAAGA